MAVYTISSHFSARFSLWFMVWQRKKQGCTTKMEVIIPVTSKGGRKVVFMLHAKYAACHLETLQPLLCGD